MKSLLLTVAALTGAPLAAQPATPAPDYTQDSAWLCRPGRAGACAANQDVTVVAANGTRRIERFRTATKPGYDCFYVYPTVSLDAGGNSDMIAGSEERQVAAFQAARFARGCRVYAPLYRQVTLTALRDTLLGKPTTADRPLALADVKAAWTDYLTRDNRGRGVVLIGHSQGATVLKQLVASEIEGKPAQALVISAMLIGTNIAVAPGSDVGGDFKTMPLCRSDRQTGCVVSYVTFRADSPPPPDSRFGKANDAPAACTNPAALGGGRAVTDAILGTAGAGLGATPMGAWSRDGAAVTTSFVKVPRLIVAECVVRDGFGYLAVSVDADPADARTDTIVGDVSFGGVIRRDWGLHLIDMPVAMGNLVALADRQAIAWMAAARRSR